MTFLLLVMQWPWRKHAPESLAQSEFIAALFIDPIIYENNRKVYMPWWTDCQKKIEVGEVMAASQAQETSLHPM
ncbi:hypothetical protein [Bradyrhizobium sp.]|jgi:hypothetical protein|uniref:hypothetical protein n=1 Tax=Bradyrhizobium sp. TaxID=376 RepID=UPI002E00CFDD|nr:hypothetical protein [Bradyrhizobium sp.]